jgi:hypothetical protein
MSNTTPKYDPDREYEVVLKRPVSVFGSPLLPLHRHTIRGDTLNLIVQENSDDAVDSATAVA